MAVLGHFAGHVGEAGFIGFPEVAPQVLAAPQAGGQQEELPEGRAAHGGRPQASAAAAGLWR